MDSQSTQPQSTVSVIRPPVRGERGLYIDRFQQVAYGILLVFLLAQLGMMFWLDIKK